MLAKIVRQLTRKLRQIANVPVQYRYDGFVIKLPADHRLPEYQRRYPKYDRFLPHLASYVEQSGTIVDIGANVGDTLAAMIERNPAASYICIEPDEQFHRYLEGNAQRIRNAVGGARIRLIKSLVGKTISNVSLDGKGGTKHAVPDAPGGLCSQPLDALIPDGAGLNIRLVKSDVDGFDYDVLDSAHAVLDRHGPMLFFECYQDHEYQKQGYSNTLRSLAAAGYRDWTVFDNFGEVVVRTGDIAVINQLMDYVWKQNTGSAARTIHYFDILAVRNADSALIDRVLAEYR